VDVDCEYRVTKTIGFFVGARNITGVPFVYERYGPNTPPYARRYDRNDYGIAISAGMKGTF
jgi:hypothetical protein